MGSESGVLQRYMKYDLDSSVLGEYHGLYDHTEKSTDIRPERYADIVDAIIGCSSSNLAICCSRLTNTYPLNPITEDIIERKLRLDKRYSFCILTSAANTPSPGLSRIRVLPRASYIRNHSPVRESFIIADNSSVAVFREAESELDYMVKFYFDATKAGDYKRRFDKIAGVR